MADKKKTHEKKEIINYLDLLYMTPTEVTARELADLLQDQLGMTVELWEAMNVLELILSNQNSVDFEPLPADFKDPSDAAFIKNRNIRTIFAINLSETDLSNVSSCFEPIIDKFGGFLCADSTDFTPVYVGSSKK